MENIICICLTIITILNPYMQCRHVNTTQTYASEVLIVDVKRSTNFVIDSRNTLFFSYDSVTPGTIYYLASYNLINKELKYVLNIQNGRATAIDHRTDMKYFGAGQTVHRYNEVNNNAEYMIEVNDIYSLQKIADTGISFTDIMGDVYQINETEVIAMDHLKTIRHMAVDRGGKIFYDNDTGLYDFDPRYNETRQYFLSRTFFIKQISVDRNNDVYVGGIDGIFKLNQNNCTAAKVGKFSNVYGLAFDRFNNLVYSNEHEILRAFISFNY